MAADFFQPVYVTLVPEGDNLIVKAVNDLREEVDVLVIVSATKTDGTSRKLLRVEGSVFPDGAIALGQLAKMDIEADEIVTYTWTGSDGTQASDHFMLRPYKSYDLHPPQTKLETAKTKGSYEIVISASSLALYVSLEADIAGQFSQNVLTLLPETATHITFTPKVAGQRPLFTLNDLHSATYG